MANAAPAKAKAKKAAAPSKDAVEGDLSLALMKEQHALLARHSIAAPPLESAAGVDAGLSAEQLKEAGNQHFRKEQYRQAKRCYAAVLRVQASDVLHSNRAAAYQKLGKHRKAIADCRAALALNPTMQKALFRLGTSHAALGEHAEAVKAFEHVLQLGGSHAETQRQLELSRGELSKESDAKRAALRELLDMKERKKADEPQLLLSMSELVRSADAREAMQRGRLPAYVQRLKRAPEMDADDGADDSESDSEVDSLFADVVDSGHVVDNTS